MASCRKSSCPISVLLFWETDNKLARKHLFCVHEEVHSHCSHLHGSLWPREQDLCFKEWRIFLSVCREQEEVGLRVSNLSGEFTLLDPLVPSDFAQLLEEPDSVTILSHCGLALSQRNAAIPRKLPESKGVIAGSATIFSGSSELELFLTFKIS